MISAMNRFEVVGPRDLLWDTLDVLQDAGCCHLDPAPLGIEGLEGKLQRPQLEGPEAQFRAEAGELAAQYEAVLGSLPASVFRQEEEIAATSASLERRTQEELLGLARTRLAEWRRAEARIHNLQEDMKLYQMYSRILDGLDSLRVHPKSVVIPVLVDLDKTGQAELIERVRQLCTSSRSPVEANVKKLGGGSFLLALAIPVECEAAVREFLWEQKISEAVFPQEFANLAPLKIRDRIESRLETIPGELEDLRAELDDYLGDFGIEMVACGWILADTVARYDAYMMAALSEYAFQLVGWAPMGVGADIEARLARVGNDVIGFQTLPPGGDQVPPTKLSNPGPARPFETLLALFPPPTAGSVDPTVLCFFTFPLFFGWMVGDAGYGAIMLLMALSLRFSLGAKIPALRDVSYIFGVASFSAIVFGVLFGEYFGHLGVFVATKLGLHASFIHTNPADPWHGHMHLWIGRTPEYLPKYLAYSCLLGVFHMTVSLLLGISTAVGHYLEAQSHEDHHHMEHALAHALEKIAMLIGLGGFLLVAMGGLIPDLAYVGQQLTESEGLLQNVGLGMIVASIGILIWALPGMQKVTAPIEGVAILSNTVSYSRLMAVGVAGVVLANMANDLGRLGFGEGAGPFMAAGCVVGAVLLHVLALLIAVFDPMIQALRLHYVEFFSKFYESGGVTYTPLARKGGSYA